MKRINKSLTSSKHPYGNIFDFLDRVDFVIDELKSIRVTMRDHHSLVPLYEAPDEAVEVLHNLVEEIYQDLFDTLIPIVQLLSDMWSKGEEQRLHLHMQSGSSFHARKKMMKDKWDYLLNLDEVPEEVIRYSNHARRRRV
jgi:hypothetical protein